MRTVISAPASQALGAAKAGSVFALSWRWFTLASLALTLVPAQPLVRAQSPASPTAAPIPKPVHRRRPSAAHKAEPLPPPEPAPLTPPEPERPKWPAFDPAAKASVVWDSRGLKIDASNSSLQQILADVSAATGLKVEGMTADERVFGNFGPGQARDVLSQLLQGSGYNVMMVGDQGQGTPRQLLLSVRQASTGQNARPAPTQNNDEDPEPEEPPEPQEPQQGRPLFPQGSPVRTPQQVLQEMQQRQQELQQRQQQQQPPQPQ